LWKERANRLIGALHHWDYAVFHWAMVTTNFLIGNGSSFCKSAI
jgi:hypothetical protein